MKEHAASETLTGGSGGDRGVSSLVWVLLLFALVLAMIGVIGAFTSGFGLLAEPGPPTPVTVEAANQSDSVTGQLLVRMEHRGEEPLVVSELRITLMRADGEEVASFHGNGGGSPSEVRVASNGEIPPSGRIGPGDQLQLIEPSDTNYDALDPGVEYRVILTHAPSNATLVNTTVTVGRGTN